MVSGIDFFGTFFDTPHTRRNERAVDERAMEILRFVGMDHLKDQAAETTSHGWQRTLSLATGLASRPSLLLLDEPVTGLDPEKVTAIMNLIGIECGPNRLPLKNLSKAEYKNLESDLNQLNFFNLCAK